MLLCNPVITRALAIHNLRYKLFFRYLSLAVLLFYAIVYLYLPLLNGYFQSDDTQWIWFAASKSPSQIFFSPDDYRAISSANFTPMMGISIKIDWMLFGMNPFGYHLHSLISTIFVSAALFLLLKTYLDWFAAALGASIFFYLPTVYVVFSWISTRHYMEGMLFCLLSIYFFRLSMQSRLFSALSGFFYLISMLYKEIYILCPFIVVLFQWRFIIRHKRIWIVYMLFCFCVYLLWRTIMLSGKGGYVATDNLFSTLPQRLLSSFNWLSFHLTGINGSLFIASFVSLLLLMNMRSKFLSLKALAIFFVLFVPVLPVLSLVNSDYSWSRYFMHIGVYMLAIAICTFTHNIYYSSKITTLSGVIIFTGLLILFIGKDIELRKDIIMSQHNSAKTAALFLLNKPYIAVQEAVWFYEGLREIYRLYYAVDITTKLIPFSELQKYMDNTERDLIIKYGYPVNTNTENITQVDNALSGSIKIEGYLLSWDLSISSESGDMFFLLGGHSGIYNGIVKIPTKGNYMLGKYYPDNRSNPATYLRILFRQPDGIELITKEYKLEFPSYRIVTIS